MTSVQFKNCIFVSWLTMRVQGLLSVDNCTLFTLYLVIYRGRNEQRLPNDKLTPNLDGLLPQMHLRNLLFTATSVGDGFGIETYDIDREIVISGIQIKEVNFGIVMDNKDRYGLNMTTVKVLLQHSEVKNVNVKMATLSLSSRAMVIIRHVTLFLSNLYCSGQGPTVLRMENCTVMASWGFGLDLQKVALVEIQNSQFVMGVSGVLKGLPSGNILGCPQTCGIRATRGYCADSWVKTQNPWCKVRWCSSTIIHIESTKFIGNEGTIISSDTNLIMENTVFQLTENTQPATIGKFIDLDGWGDTIFWATNTTIDASKLPKHSSLISIMLARVGLLTFDNVRIICPIMMTAREQLPSATFPRRYKCEQQCQHDQYSFRGASLLLEGTSNEDRSPSNLSHALVGPECFQCPVGAKCNGSIKALPNYWGYRTERNVVRMVECPDGYCCAEDKYCTRIDSCQINRRGTLCGMCGQNWTESLFSPKCIPLEKCYSGLILGLYCICVIVYAIGPLIINHMKVIGPNAFRNIRHSFQKSTRKDGSSSMEMQQILKTNLKTTRKIESSEQKPRPNFQTEDKSGSMKYIQILFYYVQDASLFSVRMPGENLGNKPTIVKVLQFSPEVLTTIYNNVSNLCFSSGTTAVIKVVFRSLFGPCVMLVLAVVYLAQGCFLSLLPRYKKIRVTLNAKLMETYLLVVLFSYQQMVMGTFSLIQCVEVGGQNVLRILGEIKCFTWWQIILKVYIVFNLVPLFFVLSHTSFYVQKRKMSVRMFVLACLVPLPVLIFQHVLMKKEIPTISVQAADPKPGVSTKREMFPDASVAQLDTCLSKADSQADFKSVYSLNNVFDNEHDLSNDNEKKEENTREEIEDNSDSRGAIVHTLLHHYKPLSLLGIQFNWLFVHKLYRIVIVVCSSYITDPLTKLYWMTVTLLTITMASTFIQPYKDIKANKTAFLSYTANICIAIINLTKTGLVKFGCETNCSDVERLSLYLGACEKVLLVYVPIAALGIWLLVIAVQKYRRKAKEA